MAIDPDGEATDTEATETGRSQTQNVDRPGEEPPPFDSLAKGTPLGRYLILERLGQGNLGVVYAAYDPQLDRKVALKLLRGGAGGSAEASSGTLRLLREAQAMAKVVHPNVCAVHEVGTWFGRVFLAMEQVDGSDLEDWLKAAPRRWQEVLDVFVSAGHGLAAAHDAGRVHRDFKPQNVLVGRDGRPRVTDFGLLRHAGDQAVMHGPQWSTPIDGAAATEGGVAMGTPGFIAPEQMEGLAATPAADQFSFAVALWRALYGQRPFAGHTMLELHQEIEHGRLLPPPPGVKVPRYLRPVLTRALAYPPARRYGSIRELLAALKHDPAVTLKRALVYLGVALAVLAAAGGIAVLEWRDAHRCERVGSELNGVWDDARRAQLRSRFESWGAQGGEALPSALKWIDTYAQLWVRERQRACELERKGKEDPRLTSSRNACIGRRRLRLKATIDTLLDADRDSAEQARRSYSQLGMVKACEGAAIPDRGLDETGPSAVAVQEQITRAELLAFLGRPQEAQAEAKEAAEAAKKDGQHRLAAEAWSALAASYELSAGSPAQIEARKQALLEAESGHEDEQVFDAQLNLALALAYGTTRYDEALWLLDQAEATASRLALPPSERIDLYRIRAEVLEQAERPEEALPWAKKAYESLPATAPDPYEAFRALQTFANVTADLGDVVGSEPLYEKLIQLQEANGESKEGLQHLQLYLAEELLFLGRYQDSLPHFERAQLSGAANWHAVDNAAAAGWAAYAYAALGDFEKAHQLLAVADGERAALTRPNALVEPMLGRMRVQLFEGDYGGVVATEKELRTLLEPEAEANRSPLLESRLLLVEALRRQGKLADAYGALQPVLMRAPQDDAAQIGLVDTASARIKLAEGVPVPNAAQTFEDARAAIEKLEGTVAPDLVPPLLGLAAVRGEEGNQEAALAALQAAHQLAKNGPGDRFRLAETSHALSLWYQRAGDEAKAKELDATALHELETLGADVPLRRELEGPRKKLRR